MSQGSRAVRVASLDPQCELLSLNAAKSRKNECDRSCRTRTTVEINDGGSSGADGDLVKLIRTCQFLELMPFKATAEVVTAELPSELRSDLERELCALPIASR